MKILPDTDLWKRKPLLNFGRYPKNVDLCQCITTLDENFTRYRSLEKKAPVKFWELSGECRRLPSSEQHHCENFTRYGSFEKKASVKFRELSRECRPLPSAIHLGGGMHSPSASSLFFFFFFFFVLPYNFGSWKRWLFSYLWAWSFWLMDCIRILPSIFWSSS